MMSSNSGVSIRPIFSVPGQPVQMKDITDFYRMADGNRDGKLAMDEIRTFRQLQGLALAFSIGDKEKKELYKQEFGRFDGAANLCAAFGNELGLEKDAGIPLSVFTDLAKKDGNDKDVSAKDLGKLKWYYGDEKGGFSHEEPVKP